MKGRIFDSTNVNLFTIFDELISFSCLDCGANLPLFYVAFSNKFCMEGDKLRMLKENNQVFCQSIEVNDSIGDICTDVWCHFLDKPNKATLISSRKKGYYTTPHYQHREVATVG